MSIVVHETFGVNKKKGFQGYQFNYPYEGCIFDKTNQRYAEYKQGWNDEGLCRQFQIEYLFFPRRIQFLKWKDIKEAVTFYKTKKEIKND